MKKSLLHGRNVRVARGLTALALTAIVACSVDRGGDVGTVGAGRTGGESPSTSPGSKDPSAPQVTALTPLKYSAGPADFSRSIVQRGPRVEVAYPEISRPFRSLPSSTRPSQEFEHEMGMNPNILPNAPGVDPVLQANLPVMTMPATIVSFAGLTNAENAQQVSPPDTNGAVGPNHYVQTVNLGIQIWNKTGTVVQARKDTNALWTGYTGTNAGNGCANNNNGDPVVVYDPLADRWFITQFSLPNLGGGPNFQCVAVSTTADPTGTYALYDFSYPGLNDYGKFGIWPDAYYATFNMFNSSGGDSDICAYDRVKMLAGQPATQHCFQQSGGVFGVLPISMDGKVPPPIGEPGFMVGLSGTGSALDLWKFHVDWATPGNSTLTGPTSIPVAAFTPTCNGVARNACVPQPGGSPVSALSDRLMFRLSYRNFGTHEAVLVNHAVAAGGASGVRWYEIRTPSTTPTIFQQGTYAPNDGNWRFGASLAQDQAQDFALGYSYSSATTNGTIAWTGRVVGDAAGTMGQGESVIIAGGGHESGANRWGDYSNMTVDPSDDCTFWYTQEMYVTTGFGWSTQVASVKFPNCGANDFSLTITPALQSIAQAGTTTFTVTTASTKGTPESIALNIQDLPSGVSGAFAPASVTAGSTSTLTLTATAAAPLVPATTFTVIGKAPAAVHAATAQVAVVNCGAIGLTCCATSPACTGGAPDACHGAAACNTTTNKCENPPAANGTACTLNDKCQTNPVCTAGVCGGTAKVCTPSDTCHVAGTCAPATGACSNPVAADGTSCLGADKCKSGSTCAAGVCVGGGPLSCTALDECHTVGTCSSATGCSNPTKADGTACSIGTCQSGTCTKPGTPDAGTDVPAGNSGGCGCRTVSSESDSPALPLAGFGALALVGVARLRRRRR